MSGVNTFSVGMKLVRKRETDNFVWFGECEMEGVAPFSPVTVSEVLKTGIRIKEIGLGTIWLTSRFDPLPTLDKQLEDYL